MQIKKKKEKKRGGTQAVDTNALLGHRVDDGELSAVSGAVTALLRCGGLATLSPLLLQSLELLYHLAILPAGITPRSGDAKRGSVRDGNRVDGGESVGKQLQLFDSLVHVLDLALVEFSSLRQLPLMLFDQLLLLLLAPATTSTDFCCMTKKPEIMKTTNGIARRTRRRIQKRLLRGSPAPTGP
jgi:hypothetical protein